MDIVELLKAWPIKEAIRIEHMQHGTNNRVWCVESVDGQKHILRVLSGEEALSRVRYEAALLSALSEKELPFRLPLPLRARCGDIVVPFEQETGFSTIATLHPFFTGIVPERTDLIKAAQAGAALAALDGALATLPEQFARQPQALATFADLAHYHVLIPEPLRTLEQLPVACELSRPVRNLLAAVIERTDGLYRRLPQQLLHLDYSPGNVLMDDAGVTAVLDFEFACRDLRVLDLCVALNWWPVSLMGTGKEWAVIDAFGAAYVHDFPLSAEELQAIPDILRLRDAGSLIHRIGRYLSGLENEAVIESRLQQSLWREEWLAAHHAMLTQHALSWLA